MVSLIKYEADDIKHNKADLIAVRGGLWQLAKYQSKQAILAGHVYH